MKRNKDRYDDPFLEANITALFIVILIIFAGALVAGLSIIRNIKEFDKHQKNLYYLVKIDAANKAARVVKDGECFILQPQNDEKK